MVLTRHGFACCRSTPPASSAEVSFDFSRIDHLIGAILNRQRPAFSSKSPGPFFPRRKCGGQQTVEKPSCNWQALTYRQVQNADNYCVPEQVPSRPLTAIQRCPPYGYANYRLFSNRILSSRLYPQRLTGFFSTCGRKSNPSSLRVRVDSSHIDAKQPTRDCGLRRSQETNRFCCAQFNLFSIHRPQRSVYRPDALIMSIYSKIVLQNASDFSNFVDKAYLSL